MKLMQPQPDNPLEQEAFSPAELGRLQLALSQVRNAITCPQ